MTKDGSAYSDAAIDAMRWVESCAITSTDGPAWPNIPGQEETIGSSLYDGAAGVLVAFTDATRATTDGRFLAALRQAADQVVRSLDDEEGCGFYDGLAGAGFALTEAASVTGDERYRDSALEIVRTIRERASLTDGAAEWHGYTDVIFGAAGTGLALIHVSKALSSPDALDLAVLAGRGLLGRAVQVPGGLKWGIEPDEDFYMPNFSHGTSGIAYFLATLYMETGEQEFLDAALAGAAYLLSVARTDGGTFKVFYAEPGGEELFPLGWCHGPTGTARLFRRLEQATGDESWREWLLRAAATVRRSGIPERLHPGFWDNVAPCCGSTRVAELFLDLYRLTQDEDHLAFSITMTDDLLARATVDETGTRWSNYEHRADPPELPAETGYMKGASGIACWMLRIGRFLDGHDTHTSWPDSPF